MPTSNSWSVDRRLVLPTEAQRFTLCFRPHSSYSLRCVSGSPFSQDRAGARKGLNGNAVRKATAFQFRGCPCNCKRRARCTCLLIRERQPLGRGSSSTIGLGRRASSLDPRARRPASAGSLLPWSRGWSWHGTPSERRTDVAGPHGHASTGIAPAGGRRPVIGVA